MAQVMMGPPLSPRETRRSGRRSGPSVSSHSPESDIGPRLKDPAQRPPLVSSSSGSSNGRNKRLKQEEVDDLGPAQSASTSSQSSSKRKSREKEEDPPTEVPVSQPEEDEEGGVTRCICGSTGEDDPDAGEFMVQCETCKVWQHGLCMGYESEDQLHEGDYYCEQCRPDMHVELLKKLARRPRHSSSTSHGANSRLSRSHSPHQSNKQPSKRRNTMNSRDAAFDENLKQILETTAIEAGADPSIVLATANDQSPMDHEELLLAEPVNNNRNKKRKRSEVDPLVAVQTLILAPDSERSLSSATTKKRTRSMSPASDHPPAMEEEAPVLFLPPPPPPPVVKPTGRNKRGGRKTAPALDIPVDPIDGITPPAVPPKRSGNSHRKGAKSSARPPQSSAGTGGQASGSDSRRAPGSAITQTAADSRAYRNSHAYVVSQQPLYTSWHLPDYLSHLEEMLPTEIPKPLEVVAGVSVTGPGPGRESVERTTERGVKVKWPSKRTSVADMNKRVRALVEWVGREQASASDRARRREALEKATADSPAAQRRPSTSMGDMEALMDELIKFQEKFGVRRERRS